MNNNPNKRPKPGDSDDQLLQMQEEFDKKKFTPSAKVVSLHAQQSANSSKKQSKFARNRDGETEKKRISTSQDVGNLTNTNIDIDMGL